MQSQEVIRHSWCAKTKFLEIYGRGDYLSLGLPSMLLRSDLPCISIDISAATGTKPPHITIAKGLPGFGTREYCELCVRLQDHIYGQGDDYMMLQFNRPPERHAGSRMFLTSHCTLATLLEGLSGIVSGYVSSVSEDVAEVDFVAPHVTLADIDAVVPVTFTEKSEEYRWHMQHSPDMSSSWWLDWVNEEIHFNVNVDDENLSIWRDPATGLCYEYDKRTCGARVLVDEEICHVITIKYHFNMERQLPTASRE